MNEFVIAFVGMAGFHVSGQGPPPGKYLAYYDPDAMGGLGEASWTNVLDQALRFGSGVEAFGVWKAQSTFRPLRDDGKPNRPLTAYTVEILSVSDIEEGKIDV